MALLNCRIRCNAGEFYVLTQLTLLGTESLTDDDGQIPHQASKCLQVITIFYIFSIFFLVISLSSGTLHLRLGWGSDKEGRYASNDNNREGIAHCV